jgi:PRTRC genetic system protein F
MKFDPIEIERMITASRVVPAQFQLPGFHSKIPSRASAPQKNTTLAHHLVTLGIIDTSNLSPDGISTPTHLLERGLADWFNRKLGKLSSLDFSLTLYDRRSVIEQILDNGHLGNEHDDLQDEADYYLAVWSPPLDYYQVDQRVEELESLCPGLFNTALHVAMAASFHTAYIRTPDEFVEEINFDLFDGDWPDNDGEEVLADLTERMGDTAKDYLPSELEAAIGDGYLTNVHQRPNHTLDEAVVTELTRAKDLEISQVAQAVIRLAASSREVRKLKTRFPDLRDYNVMPLCPTATLLYNADSRILHYLDGYINRYAECGEGTELLGLQALPADRRGLRTYFQNMEKYLTVIADLDRLIALLINRKQKG